MSTDEMIEQEMKNNPSFAEKMWGAQIPFVQPAPKVKRVSGIALRLRWKKFKAENFLKALDFGEQILAYGITKKAAVLSVMKQHHVRTREARLIIKDALPKKHRSRS